jgi:uncharacterized protein YceK
MTSCPVSSTLCAFAAATQGYRCCTNERVYKSTKICAKRKGILAMRYLWLAFLVPLAGCSYVMPITDADENGGTVNLVGSRYGEDSAMQKAADYCSQYHRVAQKLHHDPGSSVLTFTCNFPDR